MRVTISVARTFEMDEAKVLADFAPVPEGQTREAFLRESFYELCGFERDEDHIDGSFVRLVDEASDADFFPGKEETT